MHSGLHAHCNCERKRGCKNASFDCCGTLKDCSCCHPQLVSALPNHSGRASTDGGIWCSITLHRQSLGAQAWGRRCSIKHSRCRLFPWGSQILRSQGFFFFPFGQHGCIGIQLGWCGAGEIESSIFCPPRSTLLTAMQLSVVSGCSIEHRAGVWCSTQHLSALPTALRQA